MIKKSVLKNILAKERESTREKKEEERLKILEDYRRQRKQEKESFQTIVMNYPILEDFDEKIEDSKEAKENLILGNESKRKLERLQVVALDKEFERNKEQILANKKEQLLRETKLAEVAREIEVKDEINQEFEEKKFIEEDLINPESQQPRSNLAFNSNGNTGLFGDFEKQKESKPENPSLLSSNFKPAGIFGITSNIISSSEKKIDPPSLLTTDTKLNEPIKLSSGLGILGGSGLLSNTSSLFSRKESEPKKIEELPETENKTNLLASSSIFGVKKEDKVESEPKILAGNSSLLGNSSGSSIFSTSENKVLLGSLLTKKEEGEDKGLLTENKPFSLVPKTQNTDVFKQPGEKEQPKLNNDLLTSKPNPFLSNVGSALNKPNLLANTGFLGVPTSNNSTSIFNNALKSESNLKNLSGLPNLGSNTSSVFANAIPSALSGMQTNNHLLFNQQTQPSGILGSNSFPSTNSLGSANNVNSQGSGLLSGFFKSQESNLVPQTSNNLSNNQSTSIFNNAPTAGGIFGIGSNDLTSECLKRN